MCSCCEVERTIVAIGTLVPVRFTGSIFSIHAHAINVTPHAILAAPELGQVVHPPLISVIDQEHDLTGASVLVSSLPIGASLGEEIQLRDGTLYLGPEQHCAAVLGHPEVEHFSGEISPLSANGVADDSRRDIAVALQDALAAHGIPGGFLSLAADLPDTPFAQKAREILAAHPFETALLHLVGLGPGFTPSGDDFICGALAASPTLPIPDRDQRHRVTARRNNQGRCCALVARLALFLPEVPLQLRRGYSSGS